MNKPRIYIDTSVIGGCEDEEFREHSRKLLEEFASGKWIMVFSHLTISELQSSPIKVQQIMDGIPRDYTEYLPASVESEELAEAYIQGGAIGPKMRSDATHISLATIARVDVLASWNFKHIVNLNRIHAYNSVNLKQGYPMLEIRSPREVLKNE